MPPPTRDWLQRQKQQQKEIAAPTRKAKAPKVENKPVFGRGPEELQGALADPTEVSAPGPRPDSGPLALATLPEWYIYWALERLGKKPNVDFVYRGETEFASLSSQTQLDFQMLDGSGIAIEVQGDYFHYQQGSAKLVLDRVRAGELANQWTVIDIDEDDALRNPIYYTQEALLGRDHSYRYRNYWVKPFKQLT